MTAMEALAELVQDTINAGVKVSFTEDELKEMGVKVPKRKAIKARKPYKTFVYEVLSRAARV